MHECKPKQITLRSMLYQISIYRPS